MIVLRTKNGIRVHQPKAVKPKPAPKPSFKEQGLNRFTNEDDLKVHNKIKSGHCPLCNSNLIHSSSKSRWFGCKMVRCLPCNVEYAY